MSFFPAFIDLAQISMMEMGIILAIATISVGGVKLAYAYLADQSRQWLRNPRAKRVMNRMAGVVMIATGILVVAKT